MKKILLIGLMSTAPLFAPFVGAEDRQPATEKKGAMVMTDKEKQAQMAKMQANMLQMHEQMHKIMQATDPKEREKLTQEHLKMMQENTHMMRGMKSWGDMEHSKKN